MKHDRWIAKYCICGGQFLAKVSSLEAFAAAAERARELAIWETVHIGAGHRRCTEREWARAVDKRHPRDTTKVRANVTN